MLLRQHPTLEHICVTACGTEQSVQIQKQHHGAPTRSPSHHHHHHHKNHDKVRIRLYDLSPRIAASAVGTPQEWYEFDEEQLPEEMLCKERLGHATKTSNHRADYYHRDQQGKEGRARHRRRTTPSQTSLRPHSQPVYSRRPPHERGHSSHATPASSSLQDAGAKQPTRRLRTSNSSSVGRGYSHPVAAAASSPSLPAPRDGWRDGATRVRPFAVLRVPSPPPFLKHNSNRRQEMRTAATAHKAEEGCEAVSGTHEEGNGRKKRSKEGEDCTAAAGSPTANDGPAGRKSSGPAPSTSSPSSQEGGSTASRQPPPHRDAEDVRRDVKFLSRMLEPITTARRHLPQSALTWSGAAAEVRNASRWPHQPPLCCSGQHGEDTPKRLFLFYADGQRGAWMGTVTSRVDRSGRAEWQSSPLCSLGVGFSALLPPLLQQRASSPSRGVSPVELAGRAEAAAARNPFPNAFPCRHAVFSDPRRASTGFRTPTRRRGSHNETEPQRQGSGSLSDAHALQDGSENICGGGEGCRYPMPFFPRASVCEGLSSWITRRGVGSTSGTKSLAEAMTADVLPGHCPYTRTEQQNPFSLPFASSSSRRWLPHPVKHGHSRCAVVSPDISAVQRCLLPLSWWGRSGLPIRCALHTRRTSAVVSPSPLPRLSVSPSSRRTSPSHSLRDEWQPFPRTSSIPHTSTTIPHRHDSPSYSRAAGACTDGVSFPACLAALIEDSDHMAAAELLRWSHFTAAAYHPAETSTLALGTAEGVLLLLDTERLHQCLAEEASAWESFASEEHDAAEQKKRREAHDADALAKFIQQHYGEVYDYFYATYEAYHEMGIEEALPKDDEERYAEDNVSTHHGRAEVRPHVSLSVSPPEVIAAMPTKYCAGNDVSSKGEVGAAPHASAATASSAVLRRHTLPPVQRAGCSGGTTPSSTPHKSEPQNTPTTSVASKRSGEEGNGGASISPLEGETATEGSAEDGGLPSCEGCRHAFADEQTTLSLLACCCHRYAPFRFAEALYRCVSAPWTRFSSETHEEEPVPVYGAVLSLTWRTGPASWYGSSSSSSSSTGTEEGERTNSITSPSPTASTPTTPSTTDGSVPFSVDNIISELFVGVRFVPEVMEVTEVAPACWASPRVASPDAGSRRDVRSASTTASVGRTPFPSREGVGGAARGMTTTPMDEIASEGCSSVAVEATADETAWNDAPPFLNASASVPAHLLPAPETTTSPLLPSTRSEKEMLEVSGSSSSSFPTDERGIESLSSPPLPSDGTLSRLEMLPDRAMQSAHASEAMQQKGGTTAMTRPPLRVEPPTAVGQQTSRSAAVARENEMPHMEEKTYAVLSTPGKTHDGAPSLHGVAEEQTSDHANLSRSSPHPVQEEKVKGSDNLSLPHELLEAEVARRLRVGCSCASYLQFGEVSSFQSSEPHPLEGANAASYNYPFHLHARDGRPIFRGAGDDHRAGSPFHSPSPRFEEAGGGPGSPPSTEERMSYRYLGASSQALQNILEAALRGVVRWEWGEVMKDITATKTNCKGGRTTSRATRRRRGRRSDAVNGVGGGGGTPQRQHPEATPQRHTPPSIHGSPLPSTLPWRFPIRNPNPLRRSVDGGGWWCGSGGWRVHPDYFVWRYWQRRAFSLSRWPPRRRRQHQRRYLTASLTERVEEETEGLYGRSSASLSRTTGFHRPPFSDARGMSSFSEGRKSSGSRSPSATSSTKSGSIFSSTHSSIGSEDKASSNSFVGAGAYGWHRSQHHRRHSRRKGGHRLHTAGDLPSMCFCERVACGPPSSPSAPLPLMGTAYRYLATSGRLLSGPYDVEVIQLWDLAAPDTTHPVRQELYFSSSATATPPWKTHNTSFPETESETETCSSKGIQDLYWSSGLQQQPCVMAVTHLDGVKVFFEEYFQQLHDGVPVHSATEEPSEKTPFPLLRSRLRPPRARDGAAAAALGIQVGGPGSQCAALSHPLQSKHRRRYANVKLLSASQSGEMDHEAGETEEVDERHDIVLNANVFSGAASRGNASAVPKAQEEQEEQEAQEAQEEHEGTAGSPTTKAAPISGKNEAISETLRPDGDRCTPSTSSNRREREVVDEETERWRLWEAFHTSPVLPVVHPCALPLYRHAVAHLLERYTRERSWRREMRDDTGMEEEAVVSGRHTKRGEATPHASGRSRSPGGSHQDQPRHPNDRHDAEEAPLEDAPEQQEGKSGAANETPTRTTTPSPPHFTTPLSQTPGRAVVDHLVGGSPATDPLPSAANLQEWKQERRRGSGTALASTSHTPSSHYPSTQRPQSRRPSISHARTKRHTHHRLSVELKEEREAGVDAIQSYYGAISSRTTTASPGAAARKPLREGHTAISLLCSSSSAGSTSTSQSSTSEEAATKVSEHELSIERVEDEQSEKTTRKKKGKAHKEAPLLQRTLRRTRTTSRSTQSESSFSVSRADCCGADVQPYCWCLPWWSRTTKNGEMTDFTSQLLLLCSVQQRSGGKGCRTHCSWCHAVDSPFQMVVKIDTRKRLRVPLLVASNHRTLETAFFPFRSFLQQDVCGAPSSTESGMSGPREPRTVTLSVQRPAGFFYVAASSKRTFGAEAAPPAGHSPLREKVLSNQDSSVALLYRRPPDPNQLDVPPPRTRLPHSHSSHKEEKSWIPCRAVSPGARGGCRLSVVLDALSGEVVLDVAERHAAIVAPAEKAEDRCWFVASGRIVLLADTRSRRWAGSPSASPVPPAGRTDESASGCSPHSGGGFHGKGGVVRRVTARAAAGRGLMVRVTSIIEQRGAPNAVVERRGLLECKDDIGADEQSRTKNWNKEELLGPPPVWSSCITHRIQYYTHRSDNDIVDAKMNHTELFSLLPSFKRHIGTLGGDASLFFLSSPPVFLPEVRVLRPEVRPAAAAAAKDEMPTQFPSPLSEASCSLTSHPSQGKELELDLDEGDDNNNNEGRGDRHPRGAGRKKGGWLTSQGNTSPWNADYVSRATGMEAAAGTEDVKRDGGRMHLTTYTPAGPLAPLLPSPVRATSSRVGPPPHAQPQQRMRGSTETHCTTPAARTVPMTVRTLCTATPLPEVERQVKMKDFNEEDLPRWREAYEEDEQAVRALHRASTGYSADPLVTSQLLLQEGEDREGFMLWRYGLTVMEPLYQAYSIAALKAPPPPQEGNVELERVHEGPEGALHPQEEPIRTSMDRRGRSQLSRSLAESTVALAGRATTATSAGSPSSVEAHAAPVITSPSSEKTEKAAAVLQGGKGTEAAPTTTAYRTPHTVHFRDAMAKKKKPLSTPESGVTPTGSPLVASEDVGASFTSAAACDTEESSSSSASSDDEPALLFEAPSVQLECRRRQHALWMLLPAEASLPTIPDLIRMEHDVLRQLEDEAEVRQAAAARALRRRAEVHTGEALPRVVGKELLSARVSPAQVPPLPMGSAAAAPRLPGGPTTTTTTEEGGCGSPPSLWLDDPVGLRTTAGEADTRAAAGPHWLPSPSAATIGASAVAGETLISQKDSISSSLDRERNEGVGAGGGSRSSSKASSLHMVRPPSPLTSGLPSTATPAQHSAPQHIPTHLTGSSANAVASPSVHFSTALHSSTSPLLSHHFQPLPVPPPSPPSHTRLNAAPLSGSLPTSSFRSKSEAANHSPAAVPPAAALPMDSSVQSPFLFPVVLEPTQNVGTAPRHPRPAAVEGRGPPAPQIKEHSSADRNRAMQPLPQYPSSGDRPLFPQPSFTTMGTPAVHRAAQSPFPFVGSFYSSTTAASPTAGGMRHSFAPTPAAHHTAAGATTSTPLLLNLNAVPEPTSISKHTLERTSSQLLESALCHAVDVQRVLSSLHPLNALECLRESPAEDKEREGQRVEDPSRRTMRRWDVHSDPLQPSASATVNGNEDGVRYALCGHTREVLLKSMGWLPTSPFPMGRLLERAARQQAQELRRHQRRFQRARRRSHPKGRHAHHHKDGEPQNLHKKTTVQKTTAPSFPVCWKDESEEEEEEGLDADEGFPALPFFQVGWLPKGKEWAASLHPAYLYCGDHLGMSSLQEAVERRVALLTIMGYFGAAYRMLIQFSSFHPLYKSLALTLSAVRGERRRRRLSTEPSTSSSSTSSSSSRCSSEGEPQPFEILTTRESLLPTSTTTTTTAEAAITGPTVEPPSVPVVEDGGEVMRGGATSPDDAKEEGGERRDASTTLPPPPTCESTLAPPPPAITGGTGTNANDDFLSTAGGVTGVSFLSSATPSPPLLVLPLPEVAPVAWEGCSLWLTLTAEWINVVVAAATSCATTQEWHRKQKANTKANSGQRRCRGGADPSSHHDIHAPNGIASLPLETRLHLIFSILRRYQEHLSVPDKIGLATATLLTGGAAPVSWRASTAYDSSHRRGKGERKGTKPTSKRTDQPRKQRKRCPIESFQACRYTSADLYALLHVLDYLVELQYLVDNHQEQHAHKDDEEVEDLLRWLDEDDTTAARDLPSRGASARPLTTLPTAEPSSTREISRPLTEPSPSAGLFSLKPLASSSGGTVKSPPSRTTSSTAVAAPHFALPPHNTVSVAHSSPLAAQRSPQTLGEALRPRFGSSAVERERPQGSPQQWCGAASGVPSSPVLLQHLSTYAGGVTGLDPSYSYWSPRSSTSPHGRETLSVPSPNLCGRSNLFSQLPSTPSPVQMFPLMRQQHSSPSPPGPHFRTRSTSGGAEGGSLTFYTVGGVSSYTPSSPASALQPPGTSLAESQQLPSEHVNIGSFVSSVPAISSISGLPATVGGTAVRSEQRAAAVQLSTTWPGVLHGGGGPRSSFPSAVSLQRGTVLVLSSAAGHPLPYEDVRAFPSAVPPAATGAARLAAHDDAPRFHGREARERGATLERLCREAPPVSVTSSFSHPTTEELAFASVSQVNSPPNTTSLRVAYASSHHATTLGWRNDPHTGMNSLEPLLSPNTPKDGQIGGQGGGFRRMSLGAFHHASAEFSPPVTPNDVSLGHRASSAHLGGGQGLSDGVVSSSSPKGNVWGSIPEPAPSVPSSHAHASAASLGLDGAAPSTSATSFMHGGEEPATSRPATSAAETHHSAASPRRTVFQQGEDRGFFLPHWLCPSNASERPTSRSLLLSVLVESGAPSMDSPLPGEEDDITGEDPPDYNSFGIGITSPTTRAEAGGVEGMARHRRRPCLEPIQWGPLQSYVDATGDVQSVACFTTAFFSLATAEQTSNLTGEEEEEDDHTVQGGGNLWCEAYAHRLQQAGYSLEKAVFSRQRLKVRELRRRSDALLQFVRQSTTTAALSQLLARPKRRTDGEEGVPCSVSVAQARASTPPTSFSSWTTPAGGAGNTPSIRVGGLQTWRTPPPSSPVPSVMARTAPTASMVTPTFPSTSPPGSNPVHTATALNHELAHSHRASGSGMLPARLSEDPTTTTTPSLFQRHRRPQATSPVALPLPPQHLEATRLPSEASTTASTGAGFSLLGRTHGIGLSHLNSNSRGTGGGVLGFPFGGAADTPRTIGSTRAMPATPPSSAVPSGGGHTTPGLPGGTARLPVVWHAAGGGPSGVLSNSRSKSTGLLSGASPYHPSSSGGGGGGGSPSLHKKLEDRPICTICGERLDEREETPLRRVGGMGGKEAAPTNHLSRTGNTAMNPTLLSGDETRVAPYSSFAWCTVCLHGGHWNHLEAWFRKHPACPVEGCPCCCFE